VTTTSGALSATELQFKSLHKLIGNTPLLATG